MSKEAMKLALGKIKSARDCHPNAVDTLLFEAEEILETELAEQPAQQEPVAPTVVEMQNAAANLALMREMWGNADEPAAKVNDDGFIVETGLLLSPGTQLYTSPPAQQEPAGWRPATFHRDNLTFNPGLPDEQTVKFWKLQGVEIEYCYTSPPAQPQQEPVASIFISGIGEREFDDWGHDLPVGRNLLYTSPPTQRTWVGLTDEEIDELSRTMVKGNKSVNWLCRAIEAKLRSKNEDRN